MQVVSLPVNSRTGGHKQPCQHLSNGPERRAGPSVPTPHGHRPQYSFVLRTREPVGAEGRYSHQSSFQALTQETAHSGGRQGPSRTSGESRTTGMELTGGGGAKVLKKGGPNSQ